MNWKSARPWLLAIGAVILTTGGIGCAEERDPINRVQANALDKSFFVGADLHATTDDPEFWHQTTLVDVGYGASQSGLFTSTYAQAVSRIKWQITEDLLLGRLTYERIANSDGKGAGPASDDGQVVVAYKIQKHFDVTRAYNSSTGEELNVIDENTSDRPWYQRQYFRVDWSQNLNVDAFDFDTLSMIGLFGGVEYESIGYYVSDPTHKDAPFFDVNGGYFDITNKAFASPGQIDLSHLGWGIKSFPSCFLPNDFLGGSAPAGNCNPVELTLRQAFRQVIDTDYEPVDWDGERFQSYGGFFTERMGYARNFGMSDDQWHRFLTRYNLWDRSHYYDNPDKMAGEVACYTPDTIAYGEDAHQDENADGTEDRCRRVTVRLAVEHNACGSDALASDEAFDACYSKQNPTFGGSKCDTFKQRCTLPYRYREAKPLAWYYTNGSHQDYFEATAQATHDHDVGMRHAIQVARYAECGATAASGTEAEARRAECVAKWPVYFGQMDDHLEAQQLSMEVDDCRHGLSYLDAGPIGSEGREATCVALAQTVADTRSSGRDPMDPGVIALAAMPEQLVLCHSPVEADDPANCGSKAQRLPANVSAAECAQAQIDRGPSDLLSTCQRALNVRPGDLRYHLVNVITTPQTPSPWGIYTDAEDPLTGETISAAINVWSHVNDLFSQSVIDRIRYIKGELATEDITEGRYVRDWAKAAEAASSGRGVAPKLKRAQKEQRLADFAGVTPEAVEKIKLAPELIERLRNQRNEIATVRSAIDAPSTMAPIYQARRNAVRGTELEAELITPMMQQLAGVNGLPSELGSEMASIARGLNPTMLKELHNLHQHALAERGTCVYNQAPAPVAITGLADILEAKFAGACSKTDDNGKCTTYYGKFGTSGCTDAADENSCSQDPDTAHQQARAEAMRKYIAQRAHYAVIVHEMGHSVGERHNFVSSSDAYNYRPQYWQLRTEDGAVSNKCTDYTADGSCLGPRYFDPMTEHEQKNLLWMWMHSSVMDYAGEYTQDFLGLGAYDMAAHRMFYGDTTAVFQDASYDMVGPRGGGMLDKMDNFGGILGIRPTLGGQDIHYSEYMAANTAQPHGTNYDLIYNCQAVDAQSYKPASWDEATYGTWDPLLDGLIVPNAQGQYTKCKQQQVDYVQWTQLTKPQRPNYRGGPSLDAGNRVRVPYGFATDRWADLGNASVYRHDNGADVYEIFDFLITQQEINHIFDNYRRGRTGFSIRSATNRTLRRYNEKVRDGAKGLGLLTNVYRDLWAAEGAPFREIWAFVATEFFADNVLASGMVFDHFARTMARPEPGDHFRDFDGILRSVEDANLTSATMVTIPNGATGYFGNIGIGGKPIENRLSDEYGDYSSEYTINAGAYYDKVYAPFLMTESFDNFISDSRSDFVDGRYRAVSLADVFPDGYRRWLANNLTGDDFIKGPRVPATAAGTPLRDDDGYPSWPIGWTTWWGDTPKSCFPAAGSQICNAFLQDSAQFDPRTPDGVAVLDPQIGYEQQKFLIAFTMLYLPENNKRNWLNLLDLHKLGEDSDPEFDPQMKLYDPNGSVWTARDFGSEVIFGKTVRKGITARMLEHANELMSKAYETTSVDDDSDGQIDWYRVVRNGNGEPVVLFDPDANWGVAGGSAPADCNAGDNSGCECEDNHHCVRLGAYMQVIEYMHQWLQYVRYFPGIKGIF